jgi:Domain of unknown function (DUF4114)
VTVMPVPFWPSVASKTPPDSVPITGAAHGRVPAVVGEGQHAVGQRRGRSEVELHEGGRERAGREEGAAVGGDAGHEHICILGENTFGFEDLRADQHSDFDYNDMLVHVATA